MSRHLLFSARMLIPLKEPDYCHSAERAIANIRMAPPLKSEHFEKFTGLSLQMNVAQFPSFALLSCSHTPLCLQECIHRDQSPLCSQTP